MSMSENNRRAERANGRSAARGLYVALIPLFVSSCAVGPDFVPPEPPAITHYTGGVDPAATTEAAGTAQQFEPGGAIPAEWWRLFKSAKLEQVIAQAFTDNPGIEAAQASLRQSQANLRSGYGIFFPALTAGAGATRQRYSPERAGENLPGSIFNLFTLSASVSYALDVFGGERRTVEGLAAQVDMADASQKATYMALSANIANALVASAAYQAEIDATQEIIDLERQQVEVAEVQAGAGIVPYSNVLTLKSQASTSEASIPPLRQKLSQTADLLAILVGHAPAEWQPPNITLDDLVLPSHLPVSLPADLVRQRPDILSAEATLHAASAEIGVTTAALLPSVTLNGSYGVNNTAASDLFAANSNFWNFGANMTAPLFEGGTLWFKRKAALEGFNQAKANYRQTVLSAFAQVADTLRALEHDAETLKAEDEALATAEEALHLVQANYEAGLATYLDVLNADTQYHRAKIARLEALTLRYQDTIALFTALGGGWWNATSDEMAPPVP